MICATSVLKPPPMRIASLGPNLTLPRSVEVRDVVFGFFGGLVGLVVGAVLGSATTVIFGLGSGIVAGVALRKWRLDNGETVLSYLGAAGQARVRQRRFDLGSETAAVHVGIARVRRVHAGPLRIVAAAVHVDPDAFDERGVLRSAANRNLRRTSLLDMIPHRFDGCVDPTASAARWASDNPDAAVPSDELAARLRTLLPEPAADPDEPAAAAAWAPGSEPFDRSRLHEANPLLDRFGLDPTPTVPRSWWADHDPAGPGSDTSDDHERPGR
jgi:hypothetical protein